MDQQFKHVETNEIVKITGDMGNFYLLNNGAKIDKQLFFQKYIPKNTVGNVGSSSSINPEEFLSTRPSISVKSNRQTVSESQVTPNYSSQGSVDPNQFLNAPPTVAGVENLLNIDTSKMLDVPETQRVKVRDYTQNEPNSPANRNPETHGALTDEQKQAMIRDYQKGQTSQTNVIGSTYVDENDPNAVDNMLKQVQTPKPKLNLNENGLTEHQEILRQQQIELTGVDPFAERVRTYREEQLYKKKLEEENQKIESMKHLVQATQEPVKTAITPTNPTETTSDSVFKKFKRNYDVTINLTIKDKISKPEFIKVMSDGFEDDIIQHYTDEIFKTFLDDVKNLKKKIYDQLSEIVYGKEELKEPKETKIKKPTTPKTRTTKTKSKE